MKKYLILSVIALLTACEPGTQNSYNNYQPKLMVAATSPDYSTSDVVFIGDTESEMNVVVEERLNTTDPSDISIAAYGGDYFRLGRDGYDNITHIDFYNSTSLAYLGWQYSLKSDTDVDDPNPKGMAFVSAERAYITREDEKKLWLVNPKATNEADFLITEIDLSSFSAADTPVPHMSDMEIVGTELFVVLTRLTGTGWDKAANQESAVVVIDTTDNTIIDMDDSAPGVQAIDLPIVNASEIGYLNNMLYVVGAGNPYCSGTAEAHSGGIYAIDVNSYQVDPNPIFNDSATYGFTVDLNVASNGNIYFVGRDFDCTTYSSSDTVYVIEAGSSEVTEIVLGVGEFDIGDIKSDDSKLYVGIHARTTEPSLSAGIKVIDLATHVEVTHIETTFNPQQIIVLD